MVPLLIVLDDTRDQVPAYAPPRVWRAPRSHRSSAANRRRRSTLAYPGAPRTANSEQLIPSCQRANAHEGTRNTLPHRMAIICTFVPYSPIFKDFGFSIFGALVRVVVYCVVGEDYRGRMPRLCGDCGLRFFGHLFTCFAFSLEVAKFGFQKGLFFSKGPSWPVGPES